MNKINKYPSSLALLSALIGGVTGAILSYFVIYPGDDTGIALIFYSFIGALAGVFFGIVSGKIGYAIKPRVWASITGAALGGALGGALFPMICWAGSGLSSLSESITGNRLEQMYPEPKPIPTLQANFQELASGELFPNCAINSEGSRLVIGSGDHLTLWDLTEQKPVSEFPSDYVLPLALSPDGRILALDDLSHNFVLRNLETGEQIAKVEHKTHFAISQNGQLFAAGYSRIGNFGIMLLDPSSGKEMGLIEVPDGFTTLAISPDGRLLAANAGDNQIILWDTATLKQVGRLKLPEGWVDSMAFSPDGSRLAAGISLWDLGERVIGLWDVNTQKRLDGTQVGDKTWNIGFSSDGQKLITTGYESSSFYFWDANNLEPLGWVSGPYAEQDEAYILPDGRVLACYWNGNSPDQTGIWTIESP